MIRKIKLWWINRRNKEKLNPEVTVEEKTFTYKQLKNAYLLGYNDGKRDGLTVAREQATKSLKEILWQQNKTTTKQK